MQKKRVLINIGVLHNMPNGPIFISAVGPKTFVFIFGLQFSGMEIFYSLFLFLFLTQAKSIIDKMRNVIKTLRTCLNVTLYFKLIYYFFNMIV